jgi:hypothetical protein
LSQRQWLNIFGGVGLLSLVFVATKMPEQAPEITHNTSLRASPGLAEKRLLASGILRATPVDDVPQGTKTNTPKLNVTEWLYGGHSYVSIGELITVDQLEATDDESKEEVSVGQFIDVNNPQTTESSSPSISVGKFIDVDGVDEPILPLTADDVVSIGEFIDVKYFEPYQELKDSLFVGELIQVAP